MSPTSPDPEYLLRGVAGTAFGRSYRLLSPTIVGRAPECDVFLDSAGISRRHARLRPLEYGVEVEDLGSTNGSFVNGQRVKLGVARVGDEIAFDELRFRVGALPQEAQPAVDDIRQRPGKAPSRRWPWLIVGAAIVAVVLVAFAKHWLG